VCCRKRLLCDTVSVVTGYPSRFRDVPAAREAHGAAVDLIVESVGLADAPADRLLEALRGRSAPAVRLLDRALEAGVPRGAPAELGELLAPALDPPPWVDCDLLDAGALAWHRAGGVPQLLALTAGSLAYGYGIGSLARTLAATGRLTQMAPRRLGETSRWVLAATEPGALRAGGAGLAATMRLRLVHAIVRAHLRRGGEWDVAEWGEPISLGDTVATGMFGFFIVPLHALEDLGVRYTAAELEAMNHLWRYVSLLMGAPERFLPRTYAESEAWFAAAEALDAGPIEESRELVRALLFDAFPVGQVLPGPAGAAARLATAHALGALARRWMGDERADHLRVPDTPLKRLVPAARPVILVRELLRTSRLLGSDERIARMEIGLAQLVLNRLGAGPAAIAPEQVEAEPFLAAA
jgi:ER-bound oxygenase mpaB/B'/Rubber oxygenase, catalytic domain